VPLLVTGGRGGLKLGSWWMKFRRFCPTGLWQWGVLTRGSFRAREAAVWAGGDGAFFQPAALGEGNPQRVSGGVEIEMGSRHPGEAFCTGGQARELQWGILDRGSPGAAIYRRKSPSGVVATSRVQSPTESKIH
jgi:hypothetical protein